MCSFVGVFGFARFPTKFSKGSLESAANLSERTVLRLRKKSSIKTCQEKSLHILLVFAPKTNACYASSGNSSILQEKE